MNYKKLIAATAVTSAAFVVPAMVEASTPTKTTALFTEKAYEIGEEITAATKLTISGADQQIESYDWSMKIPGSATEYKLSNKNTLTLPQHAELGTGELYLTVTINGGAPYTQKVDIKNNLGGITFNSFGKEDGIKRAKGEMNESIQADFSAIASPPTTIFEKYEWYIVEPGQSRLIAEAKDKVIVIPVEATGKILRLVSTTTEGIKYAQDLYVNPFVIKDLDFDIKLNGNAIKDDKNKTSIAPNDTLSVENLKIKGLTKHKGTIDILKAQAVISYQWYYKAENDVYSKIPEATGATFLVPNNAFGRNLKNISVAVTVEVPNSGADDQTTTKFAIKLDNTYATDLNAQIEALLDKTHLPLITYSATTLEDFKTEINEITGIYNELSTNSKGLVKNYATVEQASANLKAVESLMKELEAFTIEKSNFEVDPSTLAHTKLVKQFEAIENKYTKFDSLMRSLLELNDDYSDNYVENMSQHLSNINGHEDDSYGSDYITASVVATINLDISKLFDTTSRDERIYSFDTFDTRAAMLKEIERLEAAINKVDRKQQAVINSSLLKAAKTDLKKVNSVAVKIADIDKKAGAKKVQAILSARAAYNKLTFMQQSLITKGEFEKFSEDAYSEKDSINYLVKAISELKNDTSYVFSGYTSGIIKDKPFGNAVETLQQQYKTLNSSAKKSIVNYNVLTQANKDISSATKVVNAINKAIDAYEEASLLKDDKYDKAMKSVQSKYSAAYKSYIKLTLLQRSIVENTESFSYDSTFADFTEDLKDLTNIIFEPGADDEGDYDSSEVANLIAELSTLEQTVSAGTSSPTDILNVIKTIETKYKALKAAEKKSVYNYSVLSNAKTLATKASTVEKTLTSAYHSDATSKMESALKAYAKLTYGQQQMMQSIYQDVIDKLENLKPDFTDLESALAHLKDELTLENILAVEELSQSVDKKELQKMTNYKVYLEALKVQKAVDSFLKKYTKLGTSPTYSKKQSILNDFNKLTTVQLNYLKKSYPDDTMGDGVFTILKSWEEELIQGAQPINDEIGKLVTVFGKQYYYNVVEDANILMNLEVAVNELKLRYKALDAKERKLVTHYSYLSKIENDIHAVRKVLEMKNTATEQAILQAYNRLTTQQQDLYNKATN